MHKMFAGLVKKPTQKLAPASPPVKPPAFATSRAGVYNTGTSESDVEKKAVEDGQAGILDPALVGVNSHPHVLDGLTDAHDGATGVISHGTREDLQKLDAELEAKVLDFASQEQAALQANSDYETAERQRIIQSAFMKRMGLPIPSKKAFVILVAALVGLFVGDWGLITLGYQVLGLSDHPWIPGLAFTDDLHLAAFSSVFALVVLGDVVGDRLRHIEHALNIRRQVDEAQRDTNPGPAPFDFALAAVCLAGALAGLASLSHIRSEYLKALGSDAGGAAFFGIQAVILLAAIVLGFRHANPEAKNWEAADRKATGAEWDRRAAVEVLNATGSSVNAGVDQRDAVLAMAGHHVNTDAANVRVQMAAYSRRYLLSQLEPAQDRLFGEHKMPREYTDDELLARITGITALPSFEKVTTATVIDAMDATRVKLDNLRARVDQGDIEKLNLPELDGDRRVLMSLPSDSDAEAPLHPVRGTAASPDGAVARESAEEVA